MASLQNLIGVVVFAVIGIILDVAVLVPVLDEFVTNAEDYTVDSTVSTLLGIVPLFVALAILLAVAGSMLSYYREN